MTILPVFAVDYGKKIIESNPFSFFSNHNVTIEADYLKQVIDVYHLARWALYGILFFTGLFAIIRCAIHSKEVHKGGIVRVLGIKVILVLLVTTFMSLASIVYDIVIKFADNIVLVQ